MDTLFLRLPATASESIQTVCFRQGHWQRLGAWTVNADLMQQWESLRDLPVVLITPVGMDTTVIVQASPRQQREAGAALVALTEDFVAEDYERLHWTLESIDDQHVLARGIHKQWLLSWRDQLQSHGLNVCAAIPESVLFSQDHDTWLWLPAGGNSVYWQMELGQGAVVEQSDIALLMEAQLQRTPLSGFVRLRYPQGVELPELPERVQPAAAPWQDWTDVLKTQNSRFWLQHPQNWLMGELAQKASSPNQTRWRWVAALAVLAVILQVGLTRLETHRIQQQTVAARAESEALYRSAFPEDRRIINLARQFKAKKAQASAVDPTQLLQLLAQTAPNAGSQIVKLEYQDAALTRVDVIAPALSDISQWSAQLTAAGISTQVDNSRLEAGIAKAKLQLRVSTGGQ